jgi:hypothetical protein
MPDRQTDILYLPCVRWTVTALSAAAGGTFSFAFNWPRLPHDLICWCCHLATMLNIYFFQLTAKISQTSVYSSVLTRCSVKGLRWFGTVFYAGSRLKQKSIIHAHSSPSRQTYSTCTRVLSSGKNESLLTDSGFETLHEMNFKLSLSYGEHEWFVHSHSAVSSPRFKRFTR